MSQPQFRFADRLRQLSTEFHDLFRDHFERSLTWAHPAAILGAFATDVLRPFLGRVTGWTALASLAAVIVLWWRLRRGTLKTEERTQTSTALTFFSIVAVLSGLLFGLQRLQGDPPEGSTARLIPAVMRLQTTLYDIDQKLDRILRGLSKLGQEQQSLLKTVSEKAGVPVDVLNTILDRFGAASKTRDPEKIQQMLEQKAAEYLALKASFANFSTQDPNARALQREAEQAFAQADFDGARRLLHQAAEIDGRVSNAMAAGAELHARAAANSLQRAAEVGVVALQYRDAAQDYAAAARYLAPYDKRGSWKMTFKQAQTLERQGEEFADFPALNDAVAAYRVAMSVSQNADDLASTQNNLGNTLWSIGLHERGTASLEEALALYREAQKASPKQTMPVKWAGRENNIAAVLEAIGSRKNDPSSFLGAAADFRDIATIYGTAHQPQDWAMAKNNLAGVLETIAANNNDTRPLAEAIDACNQALTVYKEKEDPLDWAMVESGLATIYELQGKLQKNSSLIEKALDLYAAATHEYTFQRDPLDWAMTEQNVGEAKLDLAMLSPGNIAALDDAVSALQDSLKVFNTADTPSDWARSQFDLGNVYFELGQRRNEPAPVHKAVDAYTQALTQLSKQDSPVFWPLATAQLAKAAAWLATSGRKKP